MINALHLLWIIPLAGAVGFFAAALLAANKERSFGNEQTKNDDGK